MQPTPETLKEFEFIFHEKVKHTQFSTFLSKHRWKGSRLYVIYIGIVLFFVIMTTAFFILSSSPIIYRFIYAGLGVVLTFVLVPLHEYIHLLTYKYFGAKKVTITTHFRKWYVLTHADQFVVGKREMKWIALMPFMILSICGLAILWFVNDLFQLSISALLMFHTSLCHADFLVLDYFSRSEDKIVMYDDVKEGVTYIYKQSKNSR